MKRNSTRQRVLLVGLLALSGALGAMEPQVKEAPKALLFDLGGIFFDFSMVEYIKEIGIPTIAAYTLIDWKNPGKMKEVIFQVLDNADIQDKDPDFKQAHDKKGNPMPYLLSAYQAGRYTTQEAKDLALEAFERLKLEGHFSCPREEVLIERALGLMFNPELYAKRIIKSYPDALEFLKELGALEDAAGRKRCMFIAISNWDKDSSILVRERFKEELSCFDDFVISGETGTVKPNKEIFDVAVEKSGVSKEECLFIDDQQENIDAAEALGIPSMLYKNAKQAREEFVEMGLLPMRENQPTSRLTVGVIAAVFVASGAWLFSQLRG